CTYSGRKMQRTLYLKFSWSSLLNGFEVKSIPLHSSDLAQLGVFQVVHCGSLYKRNFKLIADFCSRFLDCSARQFQNAVPREVNRTYPERGQIRHQSDHRMFLIQENHIDWKLHSDCMNTPARHEPQRLFRSEMSSFKQSDQPS